VAQECVLLSQDHLFFMLVAEQEQQVVDPLARPILNKCYLLAVGVGVAPVEMKQLAQL
jgi:hypothetical protein